MRRRTVHLVFAGVAVTGALIAGYQAVRLMQADHVNKAIASSGPAIEGSGAAGNKEPSIAGRLGGDVPDVRKSGVPQALGGGAPHVQQSDLPEAQFAHALALSRTGDPDAAFKAYKTIAQGNRADLRVAALYNIGNLHMREAARKGADDPTQLLPLVELAKQSYRDVLREQPANWDARYNLERALQLAPEVEDVAAEEEETDAPEEHVSSTLQGAKMDLP